MRHLANLNYFFLTKQEQHNVGAKEKPAALSHSDGHKIPDINI
jgi:hypothetical protein